MASPDGRNYRSTSESDLDDGYDLMTSSPPLREQYTVKLSHLSLTDDAFNAIFADGSGDDCPTVRLFADCNNISEIPPVVVSRMPLLTTLNFSGNNIKALPNSIGRSLANLMHLQLCNNCLTEGGIPDSISNMTRLVELNLSGNSLTEVPLSICRLSRLRHLYLGANLIESLPREIAQLGQLRGLYLSDNCLTDLPDEIGRLKRLRYLLVSHNKLVSVPSTICRLELLKQLQLHNNSLMTLPHDLVHLKSLSELSLRDNPLVKQFVQAMTFDPPSLRELAGRSLLHCRRACSGYAEECRAEKRQMFLDCHLPTTVTDFLKTAQCCVNPQCLGVYFVSRVEQIKFVDFCGRYKVPLMRYLCSLHCTTTVDDSSPGASATAVTDSSDRQQLMQRVLLG